MARPNPTRTPSGFLTFIAGLALLALFARLIVHWISAESSTTNIDRKRADARVAARTAIDAKYAELLNSTGWTDKAKGVAHIPIADAMRLTEAELKAKKPAPSAVKVDAPIAVVAPSGPDAAPGPPALPSAPQGAYITQFATGPAKLPMEHSAPAAPPPPTAPPAAPSIPPSTPAPSAPPVVTPPVPSPAVQPVSPPADAAPVPAKPASEQPAPALEKPALEKPAQ